MKFEAVGEWLICIPMLHVARRGGIILPSTNKKTTRCYLIETVSPKAAEAGYATGDIIVAKGGNDLLFYGGIFVRTVIDLLENHGNNVILRVRDVRLAEFTGIDGNPILESLAGGPAELGEAIGKLNVAIALAESS